MLPQSQAVSKDIICIMFTCFTNACMAVYIFHKCMYANIAIYINKYNMQEGLFTAYIDR